MNAFCFINWLQVYMVWLQLKPCNNVIRYSKFQSVGNITLHFPESFGGDTTQIRYIGFKGEATQVSVDSKNAASAYY